MKNDIRRIAAVLAAFSIAACVTGCSGEKEGNDEAASSTVDSNLVGEWYYAAAGANMMFTEDNKVSASMDYTSVMYFDEAQNLVISGTAIPADYDGTTLSVTVEGMNMFILERKGEADPDSLDGTYRLTGGDLYTEMAAVYEGTVTEDTMQMVIEGQTMKILMEFANYEADGSTLVFTETSANMLNIGDAGDATCDYVIDGDTLTLTVVSDGSEMVMERVK